MLTGCTLALIPLFPLPFGPWGSDDARVPQIVHTEQVQTPAQSSKQQCTSQAAVPEAPASRQQLSPPGEERVRDLCAQLLPLARDVDTQLRMINDRASADLAALELDSRMGRMICILKELEQAAPNDPAEAESLMRYMNDLTHVTQGYMVVLQRIYEVNAYGSEALLRTFRKYKVSVGDPDSTPSDAGSSRHLLLIEELGDRAEDVLYVLQRTKDKACAHYAAQVIPSIQVRVREIRQELQALPLNLTMVQKEALQEPKQRVNVLLLDLQRETSRLKANSFYEVPALEAVTQDFCAEVSGSAS